MDPADTDDPLNVSSVTVLKVASESKQSPNKANKILDESTVSIADPEIDDLISKSKITPSPSDPTTNETSANQEETQETLFSLDQVELIVSELKTHHIAEKRML